MYRESIFPTGPCSGYFKTNTTNTFHSIKLNHGYKDIVESNFISAEILIRGNFIVELCS